MSSSTTAPFLLTVGDALVALLPSRPVPLDEADDLLAFIGGAEVNTAIGVSRLGVAAGWLGRVGDDPIGSRVTRTLRDEGVDTSLIRVDPGAQTGIYLREWLADGVRRPYYYRSNGGGARLDVTDWPAPWPASTPVPTLLHVSGITPALSHSASAAITAIVAGARDLGAVVSVDPNYRPSLWPDPVLARRALLDLAASADILLLSEEDAQLLFDSQDPRTLSARAQPLGLSHLVFKRGARGAVVAVDGDLVDIPARRVEHAVDPVGAGDGFNAGFLAALLRGAAPDDAARCGAWCGASAVERVGECAGYPLLTELPESLAAVLAPAQADDAVAVHPGR